MWIAWDEFFPPFLTSLYLFDYNYVILSWIWCLSMILESFWRH